MKLLELFAGTRSISQVFEENGWQTYSIEKEKRFPNISRYDDILNITAEEILRDFGKPEVIWISPPCTTWSIAAISTHRTKEENGNLKPKSELAKIADQLILHSLDLVIKLQPKYYFIENPRGGLRKMWFMENLPRYTVTYCSYSDTRMKPTDIWCNVKEPGFLPMCHNGNKDCHHEPAPRGSKTGTQGLKNSMERSIVPKKLCEQIFKICNEKIRS